MHDLTVPNTPNISVLDTFVRTTTDRSFQTQSNRDAWIWRFWFLALMIFAGGIGLLMWRSGPAPSFIAWLLYLIGVIVILIKPRYGLYIVVFLTLAGDFRLTPWYPFTKNFSSSESLLFLHDAIIVSPLETYLGLLFLSWLGRDVMQRKLRFYTGPLFWPALVFAGFMVFGLVWGIARGGNLNIGLWESRAIFYMPLIMILVSNLLKTPKHTNTLIWWAISALFVETLIGNHFYFFVLNRDLSLVDRIAAHSAAIHFNTFFVLLASAWIFRADLAKRLSSLLMLPFVTLTYLAMQRRAGFLSLGIALVLLIIVMYRDNRRLFFMVVPVLTIVGTVYTGIFWNSSGALGLPAQAVKSVFAQEQASAKDRSSDIYRQLENTNIAFTVHQEPLTGVGFGQPFYMIVRMPDISHFVFWEYITHNSVVWIWMKAGVGGFLSMLFLIGLSIMTGLHLLSRLTDPDLKAVLLTAILYIIMHFTYAYVDMSWDIESMVYVGVMLGIINVVERVALEPTAVPPRRWPWQPMPISKPAILPLENFGTKNELA